VTIKVICGVCSKESAIIAYPKVHLRRMCPNTVRCISSITMATSPAIASTDVDQVSIERNPLPYYCTQLPLKKLTPLPLHLPPLPESLPPHHRSPLPQPQSTPPPSLPWPTMRLTLARWYPGASWSASAPGKKTPQRVFAFLGSRH
jgi:hypothetical protein